MLQLPLYQPQVNFNQFNVLKSLNSVISFSPTIIWSLMILVGIFFLTLSLVLTYHWKKFGIDTLVMSRAAVLYFGISALLLVTMVASMVVYLNSI